MAQYQIRADGNNGVWLSLHGVVSGLKTSTIYRTEGGSGCYQASFTFAPSEGSAFFEDWFTSDTVIEVFRFGILAWGGLMSEPTPNDDETWTVAVNGYASEADTTYALEADLSAPAGYDKVKTGTIPNNAIDYAIAHQGVHFQRFQSILASAVAQTTAGPWKLSEMLNTAAKSLGKRWSVNAAGEMTLVSDPTAPTVMLRPGGPVFGTADDSTVTVLRGYVNNAGTNRYQSVTDAQAVANLGQREQLVDLTPLGSISSSTGLTNLANRFSMLGARNQYTNVVEVGPLNLYTPGYGGGDPLMIQAGEMGRIPDAWNTGRSADRAPVQDVVWQQVDCDWDNDLAALTPVGFADRSVWLAPAAAPVTNDIAS